MGTKKTALRRIEINPEIQGGRPVIRGTRVTIHVLVSGVASGASIQEIAESYGVTNADVLAAISYAATLLEEERIVALPR